MLALEKLLASCQEEEENSEIEGAEEDLNEQLDKVIS